MDKKYVPDGIFLICDKGTLPSIFKVNPLTTANIYGVRVGNEFDKIPLINIMPHGVCQITKMPCVPVPILWSPVKGNAFFGTGRLLQEHSILSCAIGGKIRITAIIPPNTPTPDGMGFLDRLRQELDNQIQFRIGVAEGVIDGGKSMIDGLVTLGGMAWEGGKYVVQNPREALQRSSNAVGLAVNWARDGNNWRNAAGRAYRAATDGNNWRNAYNTAQDYAGRGMEWARTASPRDWGRLTGRAGFEIGTTVGTGGLGAGVRGASTAGRVARAADAVSDVSRVARTADRAADASRAARAASAASNATNRAQQGTRAANGMRNLGRVDDGARVASEGAEQTARRGGDLAGDAGRGGGRGGQTGGGRTGRGEPVDVSSGMHYSSHVDIELPGPVPFVWERFWYSRSRHRGPIGHGWHHPYDMALQLIEEEVVILRMDDGRRAVFGMPLFEGHPVFDRHTQLTLYRPGDDGPALLPNNVPTDKWRIWNGHEQVWYVFAPPTAHGPEQPLQAIETNTGLGLRFSYAAGGHLRAITDSGGRELLVETNPKGFIEAIYGPHPERGTANVPNERVRLVSYGYDDAGNLVAVTDAEGHQTHYRYANHLMVQTTNAQGLSFYFAHDGTDHTARCVHTWGDGGLFDTRFHYDSDTTTYVWDSYGKETFYMHWEGRVTDQIDANGSLWQWQYNPFGELIEERDPLGHTTRYDYDHRGNQTAIHYPDGGTLQRQFDPADRLVQFTDQAGASWQYNYDARGLVASQTDPLGHQTRYVYDTWGQPTQRIDALGQSTYLRYTEQHQLAHVVEADQRISSRIYDRLGRPVGLTDPAGGQERRQYDLLGRLTQVTYPDGQTQVRAYDSLGNLTQLQEPGQTVSFAYTYLDRLASRTQGGTSTHFHYDKEGRLVALQNEQGLPYQFELDPEGRVLAETGFDGQTRRYVRDGAGRLKTLQRVGDRATTYQHDAMGRLTAVQYPDGSGSRYGYTKIGLLKEAHTPTSSVRFTHDALGRIVAEEQHGHTLQRTYDALGQRTRLTSSLGADLAFTNDAAGRLTRLATTSGWQAQFDYDSRGFETSRRLSGGLELEWQYDTAGRPVQQRIGQRGQPGRQRRYAWQGTDQLLRLDDTQTGPTTFQYNDLGYLTGARYADGAHDVRVADVVGNLYQSGSGQDRRYGPGGQLLQAGSVRYQYDADGNLSHKKTPDGDWLYEWNGAGQLVAVKRPDGYTVRFEYDAFGRRVAKHFRGKTTRWVWDGDKPLHEWAELTVGTEAGTADDLITWLFEEDSFAPMAKLTPTGQFNVAPDHLGTPLALYDQTGKLTWEAQLDSYGRVRRGVGRAQDCPFRFQGQYEDLETGLYYNRFRYYSPEEGVYISQDPIGLDSGEPNFYAYVGNTNYWIDPLGLSCQPNKKSTYKGGSRRESFRQAKRDAGIPNGQQPSKIERVPLVEDGVAVRNADGTPVMTREYHYRNNRGEPVIIQEHSRGHPTATSGHGLEPHWNVRPSTNPRTGSVPGTHGHYNFPRRR